MLSLTLRTPGAPQAEFLARLRSAQLLTTPVSVTSLPWTSTEIASECRCARRFSAEWYDWLEKSSQQSEARVGGRSPQSSILIGMILRPLPLSFPIVAASSSA